MTYTSKDRPLRFHTVVLLAVIAIVSSTETNAQIFPVQVNPQLTPPYTPYLSDYTAPGSQRLVVRLRVNDPTLAEYRCKLRVTIEGVGITLRTKQHFIPQPIVLEGGGIPQLFYGEDLAEYFNPANLDFAGLSPGEFSKTGKLPEGVYRFSFEVLDYNRNTPVSNRGMAIAWVILNDPPILNLPQRDTKINLIDPTNIVFNWTPRHKGSPNAAFTTEYVFRLVEIWPLERNPYDAFLTQVPLYEETTQQQQILYGPAEPALIPGRKYAWQVQAIDIDKRDLFKNQGRSEVFVFQYGDALYAPDNLRLQSANPSNLTVRWDQTTGGTYATNYRVQYREHKNRSSQEWYESQTSDQWKAIPMLKPDTEYEVQVRSEQQFQKSDYSSPKIFKTLPLGENEFVCRDDAPPPPMPASTGPLFGLSINDVITVGGYEVVIRQVEGGTGQYTGEGMAIIPYLNGAKVRVVFENIRVNEQNMVTSGTVKSYWNPDSKFLLEKKTETLPSQTPTTGEIPVTIATTETLIEITGAAIATITTDEDGDIIVHTTDGKEQELQKGESYSVVDEVGNGYIIDKDGNIAKTTDEEAKAAHDRSKRNYNLALKFDKGDGTFGFDDLILRDAGNYSALAQHYQQVDDGKFIAWKAVSSSRSDAVSVIPENTAVDLNTIRFEVNAAPLQPQQGVGGLKLQVQGKGAGMVEELIASSGDGEDEQILGKLNLVSYDQLDKTVVIVPVNNAALPSSLSAQAITTQLTEIFSQAVANVRVSVTEKLNVSLDDTFDDGESGMFSNYTGDMKKVINAYGRLQDNTYYLFLVNKPASGSSALGFMPRSKQAGFIFADNHRGDPARLIRTMAHELAHGMFNLKHTFTEYPGLGEGNTQNLMDYSQGSELLKYQWDHVHDPQSVIPLFEGDEEGQASWTIINEKYTRLFNHVYDNNHIEQLTYLEKIKTTLTSEPSKDTLHLAYDDEEDAAWIKSWKIRVMDSESVFKDIIESIQKTKNGEKIPKVVLRPNHIYIGKYIYEEQEYPVAIYRNGEESASAVMNNAFTKIAIKDLDELETADVKKQLYVEETYTKYFVIAFFEEGKSEPSVMMQVEKFVFQNSMEKWLKYLKILVEEDIEDTDEEGFPINLEQLQAIFPTTQEEKLEEVVAVINENSSAFNIDTKQRMAHFLGQIGTESRYLTELKESHNYGKQTIYEVFLKVDRSKVGGGRTYKYCHLIEGFNCSDLSSCPSGSSGPNRCSEEPQFLTDSLGNFATYQVWTDSSFTVKNSFVNSESLFDLTYCCRLGNGSFTSGDGSKYKGRGFLQITGKGKYNELSNLWNEHFPGETKDFAGSDYELMETDIRVAIIASMLEWSRLEESEAFKNALNSEWKKDSKGEWVTTDMKTVSRKVNGSGSRPANGEATRIDISIRAYENL